MRASAYTIATAPSAPAKLASGTALTPATASGVPKVIASIAPSAAPADTPSVNGVASGLRSSACSTTPAAASVAPTSAPASVRGRRATKKICASTLSAKGMRRSNTRANDDRRGADERREQAGRPPRRRRTPSDREPDAPTNRHGVRPLGPSTDAAGTTVRCPASSWKLTSASHAVQRLHGVGREHLARGAVRHHAPVAQQHQLARTTTRRGSGRASRRRCASPRCALSRRNSAAISIW